MNERIKELKKQAWDYAMAVHDGHVVPPADKAVWPMDEVFDEKFAELIVRECASQVRFTDLLKCNDDSDGEILLQASVQLKQHFGVEDES